MNDDSQARAEARIGSVLNDKWTLERLLGVGGMAAVYAGRHRNGARGAVKLLHPELSRVASIRERFLREGYAANRVEHPGAVQVLDDDVVSSGADQGTAYLIMELLEGESLEHRIARAADDIYEDEALAIAEGVLDVLIAAHAHGVIHRDLKPENIFLVQVEQTEESGPPSALARFGFDKVKVLDFGLARIAHTESVTQAGVAVGTPSYMAPEQAAGHGEEIDGRSDLFAVGATMFRMLTGRRIHDAATMVELVAKMAQLPAPKIATVAPGIAGPIAQIVDRALQYRREDRYANATAMRADVRAAREGRPLPSLIGNADTIIAKTSSERPAASVRGPRRAPSSEPPPSKPTARRSAAIKTLLLLALAALGFLYLAEVLTSARKDETASGQTKNDPIAPASAPPPPASPSASSSAEPTASASVSPSASASSDDEQELEEPGDAGIAPLASASPSASSSALLHKLKPKPVGSTKPPIKPKKPPKKPTKPH